MQTHPLKSALVKPGDDLIQVILKTLSRHRRRLRNGDILAVASKVVSYSEGRLADLTSTRTRLRTACELLPRLTPARKRALSQLIMDEADKVVDMKSGLAIKDGMFAPMAGIDLSNAPDGWAVLWPKNSFLTARRLWTALKKQFRLRKFGILITDSTCSPLRLGVTGRALGWAGFEGVEDVRGKKDLYGKPMRVTQKNVADNLASAALLEMGEAGERVPFVVIRQIPVLFTGRKIQPSEAAIDVKECLFSHLYRLIR